MTKIIPLENFHTNKEEIVSVLKNGGVILYPTDTQYGLGAIASSKIAVQKVRDIKEQGSEKAISMIVSNKEMAKKYVEVTTKAEELFDKYLPGKLTLILPSKDKSISKNLGNESSIGIRIPNQQQIIEIIEELDLPITTTSSNITGQTPQDSVEKILEQLGENSKLIDIAIDAGGLSGSASTIVKLDEDNLEVVREGDIKI